MDKHGGNLSQKEIAEGVLVHCNILSIINSNMFQVSLLCSKQVIWSATKYFTNKSHLPRNIQFMSKAIDFYFLQKIWLKF